MNPGTSDKDSGSGVSANTNNDFLPLTRDNVAAPESLGANDDLSEQKRAVRFQPMVDVDGEESIALRISRLSPPQSSKRRSKKRSPRSDRVSTSAPTKPPPRPSFFIQEWHVVLEEGCSRSDRPTTVATELLREVKEEYKQTYKGQKKTVWIPLAINEFRRRLDSKFPLQSLPDDLPEGDLGRVLIKCTPKSLGGNTKRVMVPNVYGYRGDQQATYGTALVQESLTFFLESSDAPTLGNELERHRKNFSQLASQPKRPPDDTMESFDTTLTFFQQKLHEAEQGNAMAGKLLQSLKPINSLKEMWKLLMQWELVSEVRTQHSSLQADDGADATPTQQQASSDNQDMDKAENDTDQMMAVDDDVDPVAVHLQSLEQHGHETTESPSQARVQQQEDSPMTRSGGRTNVSAAAAADDDDDDEPETLDDAMKQWQI